MHGQSQPHFQDLLRCRSARGGSLLGTVLAPGIIVPHCSSLHPQLSSGVMSVLANNIPLLNLKHRVGISWECSTNLTAVYLNILHEIATSGTMTRTLCSLVLAKVPLAWKFSRAFSWVVPMSQSPPPTTIVLPLSTTNPSTRPLASEVLHLLLYLSIRAQSSCGLHRSQLDSAFCCHSCKCW